MQLSVAVERWPLSERFTIARGAKDEAVVVVVTLDDGAHRGRGESVPYPRYGEDPDAVAAQLRALSKVPTREALPAALSAGAARNALDLAWIDLEAKRSGRRAWSVLGLGAPAPIETALTLSIRDPATTRAMAERLRDRPLLKLKVGGEHDLDRVRAARAGAPRARLIVDANEGWSRGTLDRLAPELHALGVELIEQPLPAAADDALEGYRGPVPLCADESFHGDAMDLAAIARRYEVVNVKLDKQGGLTSALAAASRARAAGLRVMVGSMVATSLAIAPAVLLAQGAAYADLDGATFLRRDRDFALRIDGARLHPPAPELWG